MSLGTELINAVNLWITRAEHKYARDDAAILSVLTASNTPRDTVIKCLNRPRIPPRKPVNQEHCPRALWLIVFWQY